MAAGAGRHGNQSVHACLDRLAGVMSRRDIMEHQTAVGMNLVDHRPRGAEGCHDEWDLMLRTAIKILLKARVGPVHNQIDPEGRSCRSHAALEAGAPLL